MRKTSIKKKTAAVPRTKTQKTLWQYVERLPVSIPAALAAFSIVSMILLLLGQLTSILVISLAVPPAILAFCFVSEVKSDIQLPGSINERKLFSVAILLFLMGWTIFNVGYSTQNVFVYRDPAVYTVAGEWLSNNSNLDLRTKTAFPSNDVKAVSPGFENLEDKNPRNFYALGQHLLPTIGGLSNRVVGSTRALFVNVFIGALALLAVYGLARYFVKPRWAFVAVVGLSFSLPVLAFSRDMYTEPLTMVFTTGGIALLCFAYKTRNILLWLTAGMTLGSASLVRMDNFLAVYAVIIFGVLSLLVAKKQKLRDTTVAFSAAYVGIALPTIVAVFDLVTLSRPTYANVRKTIVLAQGLTLALLAVFYMVALARRYQEKIFQVVKKLLYPRIPLLIAAALIVLAVMVFTRPLWHHDTLEYSAQFIAGKEAIVKTTVPYSNHDTENFALQLGWYLGAPVAIIGFLSASIALVWAVRRESLRIALPALVLLTSAAFYFTIATITPDHVWASRRLLPTVIPGVVIFSVIGISKMYDYTVKKRGQFVLGAALNIVFIAALIGAPLQTSSPFLTERTLNGQLEQIQTVCRSLPKDAVVFWLGTMQFEALQTTRSYCGIEAFSLEGADQLTLQELVTVSHSENLIPFVGIITADLAFYEFRYEQFTEVHSLEYVAIEKTFEEPPDEIIESNRTILLGSVQEDGTVTPLD